jgi:hypothetical protein
MHDIEIPQLSHSIESSHSGRLIRKRPIDPTVLSGKALSLTGLIHFHQSMLQNQNIDTQ